MSIEIKKFRYSERELFTIASEIRIKVFVHEQKVPKEMEFDEFEQTSVHYLLYSDNKPVATARWRKTDEGIKLERFAVLRNLRNTGIGNIIMSEIMVDVEMQNQRIYLHAQAKVTGFYEKYGFEKVGDMFIEAGIEHYLMVYNEEKAQSLI